MPVTSDLPTPLRGVFAFLDTVLPPKTRESFSCTEIHKDQPEFLKHDSFTLETRKHIMDTFQLVNGYSPLCQFLEEFNLYHETDMATALTWAYGLHQRGKDPMEALMADYDFRWRAVLSWLTDSQRQQAIECRLFGDETLRTIGSDRWARCRTYGRIGTVVLRGDRLVCAKIEAYLTPFSPNESWNKDWKKWQALGGTADFLAGKFEWPPIFISSQERKVHRLALKKSTPRNLET